MRLACLSGEEGSLGNWIDKGSPVVKILGARWEVCTWSQRNLNFNLASSPCYQPCYLVILDRLSVFPEPVFSCKMGLTPLLLKGFGEINKIAVPATA